MISLLRIRYLKVCGAIVHKDDAIAILENIIAVPPHKLAVERNNEYANIMF